MTPSTTSSAVSDPSPLPLAFGDLQGCRTPFQQLLAKAAPPTGTPLWFAGDLINRGTESLATLRDVIALGKQAVPVLGNHDLHLLSVSAGIRKSKKGDTIDEILAAPDAADLLEWIRHRPIAHFDNGMLMVHAGVLPQWDVNLTLELADELQRALRAPNWKETLAGLYGNEPNRWKPGLKGIERLRLTCSAFDAHPLLQRRRRDGFQQQRRPERGAAGLHAVVRCPVAQDLRCDGGVRSLGRARPDFA
ncbi:symmetrical bis(5'-nucleosyl)-tetraphosphatase [Paraburkholderia sp. BL9I2N2]|uniref:symmetrical bis(5'-nucleosyl)-tetraphosphatase n=1 Tax=Paraburkholderia sp. BL9I2N2 TaxID=1938809 RepID=UPI001FB3C9C7|nr:symmetrical bis(5'-nucleosyl)-tetraphosphatase [Paraburkholderia sp. BL9I2N2]